MGEPLASVIQLSVPFGFVVDAAEGDSDCRIEVDDEFGDEFRDSSAQMLVTPAMMMSVTLAALRSATQLSLTLVALASVTISAKS